MVFVKSASWISKDFMISEILVYVVLGFVSLVVIKRLYDENKRSPGPWGVPILGFYPFMRKKDYYIQFIELAKKYGDVYSFSLFGKRYLHIGSSKSLREAFQTKADCFAERPLDFSLLTHAFRDGVSFTKGEVWKVQRKTLVQGMRELGIGAKEQMKGPLTNALQVTIKSLKESKGQPINVSELLTAQSTEVTRRLFLGENVTSDTVQKLYQAYSAVVAPVMMDSMNILLGDVAKYLILKWVPGYNEMMKAKKDMDIMLHQIVEEHNINFDSENCRDFIDIYFRDKKYREDKEDPTAKCFTDKLLISSLIQMYGDGGVAVGYIVTEFLKELALRKEVQDEIFKEISSEIGTDRLPTYKDRIKLPLMNSVIKELERNNKIIPVFTSLVCTRETEVSGVFVPKDTIALINCYAIHHDARTYKDPETFNPKRFLSDEKSKRPTEELPIFFGIGKRACPGEALVSTETFMFLTTILQRFAIQLADSEDSKNKVMNDDLQEVKIIAVPRIDVY